MSVRVQMEYLLGEFNADAEVLLLDEATPSLVKHCVRRVAKKYGGDTQRAFAICVASMQKGGYLEKGSMKLTAKGKAQSSQHAQEPDAEKKLKGYERLLKKARKSEGKSEKDLRGEALKMIAATEAAKKAKAKKMKLQKKEEVECLTCEAADKPCPECKESGGLVYEDACDCWKCEVCGWEGENSPVAEAEGERLSFDSGQFEIRWSNKKNRYIVVTGEDWDYETEEQAREMSREIRHAKSLDDAAEILGIDESVVEASQTYAQAQQAIMAGLQKDGWTLKPGLKVPQAVSPDSSYKLFFKAQAIYLGRGDSDLGGARSLHLGDIRGSTYEKFKAALERWTKEEETAMSDEPIVEDRQKKLADLIWAKTHKDFKNKMGGERFVMRVSPKTGGSELVSIDSMDLAELEMLAKKLGLKESDEGLVRMQEMRRLASLDETFKVGTTRQRADGAYKKQASGDWEKVMSGGSTPTSAAGVVQTTFMKYGSGKLRKMTPDDKDHVVRALVTVDWKTLLHDTDQNARLVQMLKAKPSKENDEHARDLEFMNKLYFAAMKKKNPPTKTSAAPSVETVEASNDLDLTEMRRLAGIDKYPDRKLEGTESETFVRGARVYIDGRDLAVVRDVFPKGSTSYAFPHYRVDFVDGDKNVAVPWKRVGVKKKGSKLMDQQQREAAGLAGAHEDWTLGEGLESKVELFLKRRGYDSNDFWFENGMRVRADVANEIADELNSLGEFGKAKVVKGGSKDEKRIDFGVYGEGVALWRAEN